MVNFAADAMSDRNTLTHAGSVAYRKSDGRVEFLVISSSNGRHWVLPQGHIEAGEEPEAAAVRELREETGLEGEIVVPVSDSRYRKPDGEDVFVRYFLMRVQGSGPSGEGRTLHWREEVSACGLLSFPQAREVVRTAAGIVHRMG